MSIDQATSNLWAWLATWLDRHGGVHGYIVHHHRDNLKILSPDTWTQAPCIMGLLSIYRKTGQKRWLELAERLSSYLVTTYIDELHVYRNSNHERKPLGPPGIIHNALASYALLEVARETKNKRKRQEYHMTSKDNIFNFLLLKRNDSTGSLISIYHGKPAYIHNMNSAAILALISLSELEKDNNYVEKYAKNIGKHIVACQVNKGIYAGAYPYVNTEKNFRTLYSLITSVGLFALYQKTIDASFLHSIEKLIEHLTNFWDAKTGLICHFHEKGYPQWIPDTLLFALIVKRLREEQISVDINIDEIIRGVISKQYENGAFPLSIGFEDLSYKKGLPSKPNIRRWRDILPTPNWNAWNFWALAELLPQNPILKEPTIKFPLLLETDREDTEGPFRIIEYKGKTVFINKTQQRVVAIFRKTREIADYCRIEERGDYWRTIKSLQRYPSKIQKLIIAFSNSF